MDLSTFSTTLHRFWNSEATQPCGVSVTSAGSKPVSLAAATWALVTAGMKCHTSGLSAWLSMTSNTLLRRSSAILG